MKEQAEIEFQTLVTTKGDEITVEMKDGGTTLWTTN